MLRAEPLRVPNGKPIDQHRVTLETTVVGLAPPGDVGHGRCLDIEANAGSFGDDRSDDAAFGWLIG